MSLLEGNTTGGDRLGAIGGDCLSEAATVWSKNSQTHPVALIGGVCENAVKEDAAVGTGGPATYGAVLQVIARVTSGAIQKDPAKLGIGELIAALQSSFADHCEGLEVGECVAVFGQAAVAEVPAALPCGLLQAVDRVQEAATGFEFCGSGVAAQDTAEDGRNTVFTGCCRQAGNFGRLIQHKRIVQVEQGLPVQKR